jgi:hypothetical protein
VNAGIHAGVFILGEVSMPARIEIAPERLAEGRDLYENDLTSVEEIAARMEISRSTLYARIREGKWQRRRYSPSAAADEAGQNATVADAVPAMNREPIAGEPDDEKHFERDRQPAVAPAAVTAERRAALYARAFRAAELQMDEIETALTTLHMARGSFERSARALAMLNRSLRDVLVLTKADETVLANEANDHSIPRDLESLRGELAQRLHALIDARAGGTSRDIGGAAGYVEAGRG